MAQALGLGIPEADVDRVVTPITALEPVFDRLAATLDPNDEPAVTFDPAAGAAR